MLCRGAEGRGFSRMFCEEEEEEEREKFGRWVASLGSRSRSAEDEEREGEGAKREWSESGSRDVLVGGRRDSLSSGRALEACDELVPVLVGLK